MINGFSEQTHELTDYELRLVPLFVKGFSSKIGKTNAITNKQIIAKLKPQYKVSDARVRKIVNYIRTQGIMPNLIATSTGYYLTDDIEELERYEESLSQRSNEIRKVMECVGAYKRQLMQKTKAA